MEKFGYGIIIGLIIVILVTPALLFIAAITLGPTSRLGRVMMVLIGEEKYTAFRAACCAPMPEAQTRRGIFGAPKVMTPAPREAPRSPLSGAPSTEGACSVANATRVDTRRFSAVHSDKTV